MRVVLDTNVVVSAAVCASGTCARIVDLLVDGAFELCVDDRILSEYTAVMRRPRLNLAPEHVAAFLDLLRAIAVPVTAAPLANSLPDPDDVRLLEVAAASGSLLVTGNLRHFPPGDSHGVSILAPAEFIELLRRAG